MPLPPPPLHFFKDRSPDSSVWSNTSVMSDASRYATPTPRKHGARHHSDRTDSSGRDLLPNSSRSSQDYLNQLKISNKRMDRCFKFLIAVGTVVLLAYVATIIYLVISLSRLNAPPGQDLGSSGVSAWGSSRHAGSNGASSTASWSPVAEPPYCVEEELFIEFKNKWDPKSNEDIFDILKDSDFSRVDNGMVCFSSLKWVPQVMGKIHEEVNNSVSYIEKKQNEVTDTVERYTGNSTGHRCNSTADSARRDFNDPTGSAVFAHFFLDTSAKYPTDGSHPIKWTREGTKESTRRGIDVNIVKGEFIIRHSGFYFLYSHVMYKDDVKSPIHRVIKIDQQGSKNGTLLESQTQPSSFLQGYFLLVQGERLRVTVPARYLHTGNTKSTYFGVYLVRT